MKRILLVADAGGDIGWGHAMRTLAVAEELSGRQGVTAVWVTATPKEVHSLTPPIPIDGGGYGNMARHVDLHRAFDSALIDLPGGHSCPLPLPHEQAWMIVDHGIGPKGTNRICPHFGAEERDWGPGAVVCGPRWMPLRKGMLWERRVFMSTRRDGYDPDGRALAYRAPSIQPQNAHVLSEGEEWWLRKWSRAFVPPSTIAYECMALGIPVYLADPPNNQPRHVGEAMCATGVAAWNCPAAGKGRKPGKHKDRAKLARAAVDGQGASRVADLLERW